MSDKPLTAGRTGFFQFSLGTLFLTTTWVAMVCIGLNTKTRLWPDIIGLVTLLALLTAVLVAIYGQGQSRAFAVGFAMFGFAFLLCLHRFDGYAPQLLARNSADALFRAMYKAEWSPIASALAARQSATKRLAETRARFVEIIQGASIMLVATLGGILARYLFARKSGKAAGH